MSTKQGIIIADFTTSLATAIAVSGTTATLQSATDDDSVALPTGVYYFTIDGGNSSKEHISCTLTSTALTNIKSISRQNVETTGVARAHRLGATVTLTNFAYIKTINDLLDGTVDLNSAVTLKYDGTATISAAEDLSTKAYVDATATGTTNFNQVVVSGSGGETITIGQIVYLKESDGEWYLCDANTAATVDNIIMGIAQGAGSDGVSITGGVLTYGLDATVTGLTDNTVYYISDTAGALSSSAGTVEVTAGVSRSTTSILFDPRYNQQITEDEQDALAGTSGTPSSSNKYVTDADTTGTGSVVRSSVTDLIQKFGGDGSDGALNVTSGTTTINCSNAAVVIKNYTTFNVSAGATLDFSNPHAAGTLIILKSQGVVTIAGTIDADGMGAAGGAGGAGGSSGTDGTAGTGAVDPNFLLDDTGTTGGNAGGGGNSNGTAGTAGAAGAAILLQAFYSNTSDKLNASKALRPLPGNGGGGGGGGESNRTPGVAGSGGAGGNGGGALLIESVGLLNYTGAISVTGDAGVAGGDGDGGGPEICGGGGGGGGGAGMAVVLYNSLTASSGTTTALGGASAAGGDLNATGTGASATAGGGGGGSGGSSLTGAGAAGGAGGAQQNNGDAGNAGVNAGSGAGGGGGAGSETTDGVTNTGGAGASGGATDSSHYLITENLWFT